MLRLCLTVVTIPFNTEISFLGAKIIQKIGLAREKGNFFSFNRSFGSSFSPILPSQGGWGEAKESPCITAGAFDCFTGARYFATSWGHPKILNQINLCKRKAQAFVAAPRPSQGAGSIAMSRAARGRVGTLLSGVAVIISRHTRTLTNGHWTAYQMSATVKSSSSA